MTIPRRRDVEHARDEHGNDYVKVTRQDTPHGEALVTVLDFDPYPDADQRAGWVEQWRWAAYKVTPADNPAALPAQIAWHGDTREWVGAQRHPQKPHGWYDAVAEAMALLTR